MPPTAPTSSLALLGGALCVAAAVAAIGARRNAEDAAPRGAGAVQERATEAARHPGRSFPNVARFYTKIGGEADFWDASTAAVRDDLVRYNDLIFIGEPRDRTSAISGDLRSRMAAVGDDVIVLRYWNLWAAYGGREARYTDDMLLYRGWPDTDPATRGPGIVNAEQGRCTRLALVDVSKPALREEVARVVSGFLDEFDGVYFDMSSWEIYARQYELESVGMRDGAACQLPPFPEPNAFVQRFLPASGEHVLAYHRRMQEAIDPQRDGRKLHFCNAVPRAAQRRHDRFEAEFLDLVDGCQMDTAFINQTGRPYTRANWRFHLDTLRRYVTLERYFLAKVPWSWFEEPRRTDSLEYGFGSFLLGADGTYALFMPAYNFHEWARDPIVSAPLGRPTGEAAPAAGGRVGEWVLARGFERGLVVVNADRRAHAVDLPEGTYRDVRRGGDVSGTVDLPPASARILVRTDGQPRTADSAQATVVRAGYGA